MLSLYDILRFDSTIFITCTYQHIMSRFNKQILQKFEVNCMNILLSLLQHLSELFCKFYDRLVRSLPQG